VGLAVLAFIVAFLPWAKPVVRVPDAADVSVDSVNGWNLALPTVATALLLVAAVLVAAPLLTRPAAVEEAEAGPAASPVPALLACLAALFMLVWVLTGGKYLGTDLTRGIGTWLGLVLGLGTAAVLVLSWLQRTGRVKKAPAAGPSNWNQGQPQGWGQPNGGYQRSVHRRAAGPAAVRAGAVPAADRRLPEPGRRLQPAGLTPASLGAPALTRGGAM
jgi:hypothetical protein